VSEPILNAWRHHRALKEIFRDVAKDAFFVAPSTKRWMQGALDAVLDTRMRAVVFRDVAKDAFVVAPSTKRWRQGALDAVLDTRMRAIERRSLQRACQSHIEAKGSSEAPSKS